MMKIKSFLNAKGLYFVMIGLLVVLFGLVAASVYFGNKLLTNKTSTLIDLKLESKSLDEQQKALIKAKNDLQEYADLEKTAKAVVPQEKDQARTVREIVKIAGDNGITISNISFPSSSLGQPNKKPATGSTPTTPAKPTTPATTAAPTQAKPVEGIPGVFQLDINVQSDPNQLISYTDLLSFLEDLEHNRRTAQVSNISVQPDTKDRTLVTFSLTLAVYIKP